MTTADSAGSVKCDPAKPNSKSSALHDYEQTGEEYGSLGSGGSYDTLTCKNCGRVAYRQIAD